MTPTQSPSPIWWSKPARYISGSITLVVALTVLGMILIFTIGWITYWLDPLVQDASVVAALTSVFVFVPMLIWKKTRRAGGWGLFVAGIILGLSLYMHAFLTTGRTLGIAGLAVGVLLFGLGVIPVSLVGTLWHHEWAMSGDILFRIALAAAPLLAARTVLRARN